MFLWLGGGVRSKEENITLIALEKFVIRQKNELKLERDFEMPYSSR